MKHKKIMRVEQTVRTHGKQDNPINLRPSKNIRENIK